MITMSNAMKCGWNDTAYGVNNWTGSVKYPTVLNWVNAMKNLADTLPGDYNRGVALAARHYLKTGKIERKD